MFGLEIEMCNIKRAKVAEVTKKVLKTESPIEVKHDGEIYRLRDNSGRIWTVEVDSSIVDEPDYQSELVTPILTLEDMPMLEELVNALKAAGARSSGVDGCGIHIHLNGYGHTVESIKNFVNIFAAHEDQLFKAFDVDEWRIREYCKRTKRIFIEMLNTAKPTTIQDLAFIWYDSHRPFASSRPSRMRRFISRVANSFCAVDHRYDASRYHALNLHAFFTRYHTIELRYGQWTTETSLDWTVLKSFILIAVKMDEMARKSEAVNPEMQSTESFGHWLLRLGLTGNENKDVRTFLLRNYENVKDRECIA